MKEELENKYISKKEIANIKEKYKIKYNNSKKLKNVFSLTNWKFRYTYKNIDKIINKKNEIFLKEEENKYNNLLSNINGKSLDQEQRKVVLTDEDNLLVVAGAGSGKTLTMLGKIIYLIKIKKINPSKILCISFTNAITEDFKSSLKKVTDEHIDVMTFHKLGISIFKYNGIDVEVVNEQFLKEIILNNVNSKKEQLLIFFKDNKKKEEQFINLVYSFINLFKSGGFSLKDFDLFITNSKKNLNRFLKKRELLFLNFAKEIYIEYEEKLEKENKIDFNDMVKESANIILAGGIYKEYDYILIDEYQDTSYIRYELLKALKQLGNSKIIAVGDDWQAIYRFTGCTLENFVNFEKYFEYSSILKIKTTYRNPQELIDIAGDFVMKNKTQITKNLKSNKSIKKPLKICFYKEKREFTYLLDKIITENISHEYYILGRNNNDINFLKEDSNFKIIENKIIYQKFPNINFYFYTVHKSKGLECDNVILINLEDSILGFPSKLNDDPVLRYVVKQDLYPYEEERRLFYVALTRTKNNVYLFCPINNTSIFVKELLENKKNIEILKYKIT